MLLRQVHDLKHHVIAMYLRLGLSCLGAGQDRPFGGAPEVSFCHRCTTTPYKIGRYSASGLLEERPSSPPVTLVCLLTFPPVLLTSRHCASIYVRCFARTTSRDSPIHLKCLDWYPAPPGPTTDAQIHCCVCKITRVLRRPGSKPASLRRSSCCVWH